MTIYKCKKCGKIIYYKTILYGSGMCKSCSHIGKKFSKKTKKKISGRLKGRISPFKNKKHTEKTKQKMSKSHVGMKLAQEHKDKISKSRKGKKFTQEHLENLSKSHIIHGRYSKNYQNYCMEKNCNKKISPNAKRCKSCSIKGKNHWNWRNGLSKALYSIKFKYIRKSIKQRDNYKCQNCGLTQKEHYKKYKRDIEIHHIDYDRFKCNENNLITLCKRCNIRANYNRDYWYVFYTYIMENKKRGKR
jgi:hypothetical protein